MAFRDATMRNAYARHEAEDDYHYHKRKQMVMDQAKEPVYKYIKGIFEGKYPNPIETITDICKEQYNFTFGNAQKLVNMTAKYLYISTFMDNEKRQLFKNCDCPMDSVMLSVVKAKNPKVSWKSDFSWSRMNNDKGKIPKVYEEFKNEVASIADKEGLLPIEVDFKYWDE